MRLPVRLYHRDVEAHTRSQHPEYPIIVHTEEEVNALEPGWCEDPIDAAQFGSAVHAEEKDIVDDMIDEEEKTSDMPKKKKSRGSRQP